MKLSEEIENYILDDITFGILHEWADRIEELEADLKLVETSREKFQAENKRLRRALDDIKIRGYERGLPEFHDMALEALRGVNDAD